MRTALFAVLAFAVLASSGAATAQQLYRWTDSAGRTHVTDTPPPANAKSVKKEAASSAPSAPSEPYALQQARKDFPVKLYSTPSCEPCNQARGLLNARGIPFTEVSVQDKERVEELKKSAGTDMVPALIVGSDVVKGFNPEGYNASLDVAGYPKAGVLKPRNQAAPAVASADKPPAEAPKPEAEPEKLGPYAPKPPRGK